jgi:hypothetical protein
MKVHFADSGCFANAKLLSNCGVRYTLQTYHQIAKNNDKLAESYSYLNEKFRHLIIDSGLFSIMFGCDKDKPFNEKIAYAWMARYINYIKLSDFTNASFVECDVQKKLSSEIAWEFRKYMKSQLPDKQLINVYHLEDGNPDKLIEYSNYLAISIPELKFNISRPEMLKLCRYITRKAVSKGSKIHLLGCTDLKILKEFSFCYSCDSTNWSFQTRTTNLFSTSQIKKVSKDNLKSMGKLYENKNTNSDEIHYGVIKMLLMDYTKHAGDQN